ncbi:MAG: hypothetical protein A2144_02915 [Chloroflexi bacterium RBG_16_50_9]|nr:MAG: hypothetical protein A2144_02915 [Chloroflexi bacterium RBG_16_50_9]
MGTKLKGKVAVVTGSGRGIGRAIALALAGEGARVTTNDITPGAAEATAKEIADIDGQAIAFPGDISRFEVARKLVHRAVDEYGRLDILVNNAGSPNLTTRIWDITEKDWDECIDVFLKGSFNCLRHACGIMRQHGWGRIINTTSVCWLGVPPHISYSAAKAGVVGLTNAAAREMGRYGITCNVYSPNAATMQASVGDEARDFLKEAYDSGFMTRKRYEEFLNPPGVETIGPLIVYLCTEEAADINGQAFDVWGNKISIYSESVKAKSIYKAKGLWKVEELIKLVPGVLMEGYKNPAPVRSAR